MLRPTTIAAGLALIDSMLAKAVAIDLVSQIARIETTDRRLLYNEWWTRLSEAVDDSVPLVSSSKPIRQVMRPFDSKLGKWSAAVKKQHDQAVERAYHLAREAGWRKGIGQTKRSLQYDSPMMELPERIEKPGPVDPEQLPLIKQDVPEIGLSFDLADEAAIAALQDKEVFWMGPHYEASVQQVIRDAAEEAIQTGRTRKWGARQLRQHLMNAGLTVKIPRRYTGTAKSYFEGVTANAMATARVQGQMRSFVDLGFTIFEIVNPRDERTCPVCSLLDGKTYEVKHGVKMIEQEMKASSPGKIKRAHPWFHEQDILDVEPDILMGRPLDTSALAEAGIVLPPYHFRCRCTVDAVFELGA